MIDYSNYKANGPPCQMDYILVKKKKKKNRNATCEHFEKFCIFLKLWNVTYYRADCNLLQFSKSILLFTKLPGQSKKISNDLELIQSDPTSCPQNQKGSN